MKNGFNDPIYSAEQQYRFQMECIAREARDEKAPSTGGREVTTGEVRDALKTLDKFLWNRRTDASRPTDYRDAMREIHDFYIKHVVLRLQGEIG